MLDRSKEMLKLDNQLCFSLYACSKEIIRLYKPYLEPFGLTYTQYITLLVLWETDGLSITALGNKLLLDSGTLTPLLKKMEKAQLLERARSKEDERVVAVYLTEKGKHLQESFSEVPLKMFCKTGIDEADAVQLKKLLSQLLRHITEVTRG